jgi:serine/threonine-protein kinase
MPFTAGDKLGPYEILAMIGKGGMGEVYRAHDPRLRRDVAIKVSAERFSERFEREARAVAALNHPNICTLYDVGPNYLVMEYIEGESPKGPLPLEEVLRIVAQTAAALEAAHEKGIVHRDLKPANIKIRPDGAVKVLDFGLAQHVPPSNSEREGAQDPTLSMPLTEIGVILGTAAYMSPEQAQGKPLDKRTDIWAFGVLLYELVTGKHLFKGDTVQETLAQVLTRDPDLSRVPAKAQPLLRRCLQRDPQRRLRDIGDAMALIAEAPASVKRHVRPVLLVAAATTLAAAAAVSLLLLFLRQPETGPRPVMRWTVTLTAEPPINGAGVALSPDGTRLVYAEGGGIVGRPSDTGTLPRLWLRRMDQFEASPIPGTSNGLRPFFSPDGQRIGYFTGSQLGALMVVPVAGGTPVMLCDGVPFYGGTWGEDDTIIYAGTSGLMRVAASGGMCQPLTNSEKGEAHRWPQFLPGSQAIVFTIGVQRSFDSAQIAVLDLKNGQQHVVVSGGSEGRYVPSGHLVYVRGGTLYAVPFDAKRLRVTGGETPIAEGVYYNSGGGFADYAFSDFGLLVYASGGQAPDAQLLEWVDRGGKRRTLPAPPQEYLGVRVSPNGLSAALDYGSSRGAYDIWNYVFARGSGAGQRLTSQGANIHPVWTRDGLRVAFQAGAAPQTGGIDSVSANAGGKPESLISGVEAVPDSLTQDGKTLFYTQRVGSRSHIFAAKLAGGGSSESRPQPLLDNSAFNESDAQVSRDGHWVAYTSDDSGKNQVYMRPFPGPGGVVPVSIEGGQEPRWSHDEKELFYRDAIKGELMVVGIQTSPAFRVGMPQALFELRTAVWDVAPDGQRFLAVKKGETTARETKLRVVDNWFDELRRKVRTGK